MFHRGVQFDGRTISVPYKASESGSLIQATGPDGERYDLKTMRVHTPSEHTFDGTAFPLEVQVTPGPCRSLLLQPRHFKCTLSSCGTCEHVQVVEHVASSAADSYHVVDAKFGENSSSSTSLQAEGVRTAHASTW